jgi:hypothetical protein
MNRYNAYNTKTPQHGNRQRSFDRSDSIRLIRIESRLVALMRHMGMKTDGRHPLPLPHELEDK